MGAGVTWLATIGLLSFALFGCGDELTPGGADGGRDSGEPGGDLDGGRPIVDAGGRDASPDGAAPVTRDGGSPVGEGPAVLPTPSSACPEFENGDITVDPAGITSRNVRIWMSDAADTLDGPLVFYWHGTGGSPAEAEIGLDSDTFESILAAGGIVAAPYSDPRSGIFPWYLTSGDARDDDLRVADEILACAIEQVGLDTRRIHSLGMSAGGLHATQMSLRRSSYLASVTIYSGGISGTAPASEDPTNKFPALIFHGGPSDVVILRFQDTSQAYADTLVEDGHFAVMCNHRGGHAIPRDARGSVWQFFQDHPYGTDPSPYSTGLPPGFFEACEIAR